MPTNVEVGETTQPIGGAKQLHPGNIVHGGLFVTASDKGFVKGDYH